MFNLTLEEHLEINKRSITGKSTSLDPSKFVYFALGHPMTLSSSFIMMNRFRFQITSVEEKQTESNDEALNDDKALFPSLEKV